MEIQRSLMFVPGSSEKMLTKAIGLENLDVAMFDLEDGVPPSLKDDARELVASMLGRPPGGPARFVRLNAIATERMEADLQAVVVPGLEGVVLPKVETADEVQQIGRVLAERESRVGLAPGSVRVIAAIETARGLLNASAIAAGSPRMMGLMFGAEDFGLDIGLSTNRVGEGRELIYARSAVIVAAAAAKVQSIDGVWPDIHDAEGLLKDATQARNLGFTGKSTFHPGQIDTINMIFSPTAEEVAFAEQVVEAFEQAQASGQAAIALRGQLIDLPIVERARRVLELHGSLRSP
jgi:citrate lyase subunit beta/citryl-CoA lyase